jgi:hypothetical protein
MSTEHVAVRPRRILLPATLAVAILALVAVPLARASDTFRFDNETEMRFTANDQDELEEGCWYGTTGVFVPGPTPSVGGSVRSEAGLGCERPWWGSNLAFDQTLAGTWTQNGVEVFDWTGGTGAFAFNAVDPLIGDSSVSCPSTGSEWSEANGMTPIEDFMTSEADGDTCAVQWLPGVSANTLTFAAKSPGPRAGAVRMIDSLALVRGGKARVRVQVFGVGHALRQNDLVLRTHGGQVIGRASEMLRVGEQAAEVAVPLSAAALKELAKGKDMRVDAAVHMDSPGGSGDTTTQLVLSKRKSAHS